jgi:hypothetical protein
MDSTETLIRKARESRWGLIHFPRGKVLCMQISNDQAVLVEPDGGYYYPYKQRIAQVAMPEEGLLASTLSGVSTKTLEEIAGFCSEPRTMDELESKFPDVEAWRLRRLGILRDVGRRNRKIISQWSGYTMEQLLTIVFELSKLGSKHVNS